MTMPPAGWYPDPASDANIRYWDGQVWTDRVQPKSVPPPPPPAATAVMPPPIAAPQPYSGAPYGYPPSAPGQPPLLDPYGAYAPAPPLAGQVGRIGPDGQILAGWWRRVGGYLLDSLIVGLPAAIAWVVATVVITSNGGSIFDRDAWDDVVAQIEAGVTPSNSELFSVIAPGFWTVAIISAAVWLVLSLFNGVYLVSRSGQTLGDRAANVRKVMAGRTVPGFGTALARWLIPNVLFALVGNVVPFGFLLSWGDYLWPLWDPKSQTLHDKMVRTYVERADLAGPPVPRQ